MDKMDKLDIYVPENIGTMLEHDAEMFEIFKTDKKTNKTTINKTKTVTINENNTTIINTKNTKIINPVAKKN